MSERFSNPFNITKAVDLSDQEISDYWVDLPGGPGFRDMAKPTSPMPMLILGGKGSGKTHLMRYFSYQLQKLRHDHVARGLVEEGYLGIYLRCGGLNAARFAGKGQPDQTWSTVFAYSMDLWLAQLTLQTVLDAFPDLESSLQARVATEIGDLIDSPVRWSQGTILSVLQTLRSWQRDLDLAVNNAAITRSLDVPILASPGRLVFGVPKVLVSLLPELAGGQFLFLYLIDELENLTAEQQKYVNTLIRERSGPSSVKIGARLYGVRTYETYSAGETNKEGSEYERLFLDDHLRENRNYPAFARQLCARRLVQGGYLAGSASDVEHVALQLDTYFESQGKGPFAVEETRLLTGDEPPESRPWLVSLRRKLEAGVRSGLTRGITKEAEIDEVVRKISVPEYALLEKANVHLLYKDWSARRNLKDSARLIAKAAQSSLQAGSPRGRLRAILTHFQGDLIAQLYSDYEQRPEYIGIATFVEMSRGLPRNLLVTLKHIFQWAVFNGEAPFRGRPISRRSQQQGVLEAAQWFFRDAEVLGQEGTNVQNAIRRLAQLFRAIRYSDKPAECSLSTFSTNLAEISTRTREMLDLAEKWSLLIRVRRGQSDRNTRRIDAKYQLNSMLAPLWDLPISRRGAIALNRHEVNAIFDPEYEEDFEKTMARRVARMTAPRFSHTANASMGSLPLFGHD